MKSASKGSSSGRLLNDEGFVGAPHVPGPRLEPPSTQLWRSLLVVYSLVFRVWHAVTSSRVRSHAIAYR